MFLSKITRVEMQKKMDNEKQMQVDNELSEIFHFKVLTYDIKFLFICVSNDENDELEVMKSEILKDDVETVEDLILGLVGGVDANLTKDIKIHTFLFISITFSYAGFIKMITLFTDTLIDKLYTKII